MGALHYLILRKRVQLRQFIVVMLKDAVFWQQRLTNASGKLEIFLFLKNTIKDVFDNDLGLSCVPQVSPRQLAVVSRHCRPVFLWTSEMAVAVHKRRLQQKIQIINVRDCRHHRGPQNWKLRTKTFQTGTILPHVRMLHQLHSPL